MELVDINLCFYYYYCYVTYQINIIVSVVNRAGGQHCDDH